MSFQNMTPDPIKQHLRDLQKQNDERSARAFKQFMQKSADERVRIADKIASQRTKKAKDAEWKPKPVHFGTPNIGTIQPAHSQFQYHQVQQPIDTSNDTGNPVSQSVKTVQPVTHHVKAVFVFLGYLALTIVFGVLVGNIFGGSFNAAVVAWAIGLYITIDVTKWMWRKHDE